MADELRVAFAGDRTIAVDVLDHLLAHDVHPVALLLTEPRKATHDDELRRRCPNTPEDAVFRGAEFRGPEGIRRLAALAPDLLLSVHFPYLVPPDVLGLFPLGCLNLHPAFLPWNRGWHTASWALLEGTPIGATLHFMDEGIDTGDVVHQKLLDVAPDDTAAALYPRLAALELEVFREAWPAIAAGAVERRPQTGAGSAHGRQDLLTPSVQRLDLDAPTTARDVIRRLRALSTDRVDEAAWFESEGRRYRVQVTIHDDPSERS